MAARLGSEQRAGGRRRCGGECGSECGSEAKRSGPDRTERAVCAALAGTDPRGAGTDPAGRAGEWRKRHDDGIAEPARAE